MQNLKYTVGGKSCYVSREAILKAMGYFDKKFRKTRPAKGRKYFVWWRGKPYPPKDVLRCMSNGPTGVFSGGDTTNQIFRDLEFHVGKEARTERASCPGPANIRGDLRGQVFNDVPDLHNGRPYRFHSLH